MSILRKIKTVLKEGKDRRLKREKSADLLRKIIPPLGQNSDIVIDVMKTKINGFSPVINVV